MKKRLTAVAVVACVLALCACLFIPASANEVEVAMQIKSENPLKARFLNMLNRNFVYDYDFYNVDLLTEDSVLALLDRRDQSEPDYIEEDVVIGFVYDMYGIELQSVNDNSSMHKDGYVYITPRGFTGFSHDITAITENEDGTFTVLSTVTVSPHDGSKYETTAETLFSKNENSAFGYNIVYSGIKGEENEM